MNSLRDEKYKQFADTEKRTFKVAHTINPEKIGGIIGRQHLQANKKKEAVGHVFKSVPHLLTEKEKRAFAPEEEADAM